MSENGQKPVKQNEQSGVEGEGSYEATHRYDSGLQESVKKGDSEKLGKKAESALEGPEGAELREAEQAAKKGQPIKKV